MKPRQASNTAKVIAAGTILLASDPRTAAMVAPGAAALCEKFLSTTWPDRWLAKSAALPVTRALWRWLEWLTLPGIIAHYWRRKRWIESRCRIALKQGYTRVIVIGAGFDTLGLRLTQEFGELSVIEIDHPATQDAKRQALGDAAAAAGKLRFIALDLSSAPLPESLHDDDDATIVIMEGLLMYLPPAEIDRLFDTLRALRARRTRIIFSFMTRWQDGSAGFRPRSRLIEWWLAWRKEPFTWAIEPAAARDFLAAHRFTLVELALTREFTDEPAATALEGENLVVCEPA